MGYLSLYRKWRPQTFEEVVGQNHITQTLSNALEKNRLSQVYLFAGSRGTGKTSVAKILARAVNCEKGFTPTPCNNCSFCQGISQGKLMDVLEIDAASNRGIDEIRDLREKISFAPTNCRYKVYIIDEVHMLTPEAFNALLKMLEEPPPHTLFVLATTEPHKIPLTILSRCQRFDFQPLLVSEMEKHLEKIAKAEKVVLEEGALTFIAQYAQGSLRDAIGILDQISSFAGKRVTIEDITNLLGIIDLELFFEVVEIIKEKNPAKLFSFSQKLVEEGKDLRQFIKGLIEHLRNLFVIHSSPECEGLIDVLPETLEKMKKQAPLFKPQQLIDAMEILSEAYQKARISSDGRFVLETTLMKLIQPEEDFSGKALHSRIEKLEKQWESLGSLPAQPPPRQPQTEQGLETQSAVSARQLRGPLPSGTRGDERQAKPSSRRIEEERTPTAETKAANTARSRPEPETEERARSKDPTPISQGEKTADAEEKGFVKIKRAWPLILNRIKKEKISTYALLLECRPERVEKNTLTLEFNPGALFHKEEMEKDQNASLVQSMVQEIMGEEVSIDCQLQKQEEKTPVLKEASPDETGKLTQPQVTELVKNIFGAEIVEETPLEEGRE